MKKILFGLLIVLLLLGTVACAASATVGEEHGPYSGITSAATTTTRAAMPATIIQTKDGGSVSYGTSEVYNDVTSSQVTARMVIYNASLTLVVDNISNTIQQITDLAAAKGGFVVNSSISEDQNYLNAYISFRVLSTNFDATKQALRAISIDVKSESTNGQDVTEQYTDMASRLRNLEASETQLLELMKQAGAVSDILAVQQELTSTNEQIEVLKGQMQYLEQSANLALFTVTLEQSKLVVEFSANTRTVNDGENVYFSPSVIGGFYPYTYEWSFGDGETSTETNPAHVYHAGDAYTVKLKVTDDKGTSAEYERKDYISVLPGWEAGNAVSTAWDGMVGLGHFLVSFFIGLGIWSPVWIVILVILYFAWWRRRKKKA